MNKLDKDIFYLDNTYKPLVRKICCQVINFFPENPLEWEDIYWEFLYFFAKNKIFDPSKNITFATFLGIECKNFARNKIKKYTTKKHNVLNKSISVEGYDFAFVNEPELDTEYVIKLKESKLINSFKGIDWLIVHEHFIDGESINSIAKKENIEYKKISRRSKIVKSKIINFLNN